jgi:Flavodoxin-like fold
VCKILWLNGHPDAGSFCDRMAEAYGGGAPLGGHQVQGIALRDLRFDLVLRGGYAHAGHLPRSGLINTHSSCHDSVHGTTRSTDRRAMDDHSTVNARATAPRRRPWPGPGGMRAKSLMASSGCSATPESF